jgi:hypothetical protein
MVSQSGGLEAYWSALLSLWLIMPAKQTLFNSSVANSVARLITIMGIYILCFGSAALLTFRLPRVGLSSDRRKKIFTWIWIAPGLVFFYPGFPQVCQQRVSFGDLSPRFNLAGPLCVQLVFGPAIPKEGKYIAGSSRSRC